ncbi:MAG: transcriptional repressor [Muribaculum sp.]|nr:transcriptional repressor [Muribaculum sp.]
MENLLKRHGIKSTPNRLLVARELFKATHPISMADLEEKLDFSLDKSSIFRVLELFSTSHLIHVIEDGSRSLKYEWCRSDDHSVASDEHPHFFCERCKETFCLSNQKIPTVDVPNGFEIHTYNYLVKGVCGKCAAGKK